MMDQVNPPPRWPIPAMSMADIAAQPPVVWHCVEQRLRNGWNFKSATAIGIATNQTNVRITQLNSTGWLTLDVVRAADELGTPVRAFFAACALAQRHRP